MSIWAFLLALGICLRLTRLITTDSLTAPIRAGVFRHLGDDSKIAEGLCCPWCISVWLAGPLAALAYFAAHHLLFILAGAAAWLTYLTGLAATWIEGD